MNTSSKSSWRGWTIGETRFYQCKKYLYYLWGKRYAKRDWWSRYAHSKFFWIRFIYGESDFLFSEQSKIAINVCTLTEMASPSFINGWLDDEKLHWPKNEKEIRNLTQQEFYWLLEGLSSHRPKAILSQIKRLLNVSVMMLYSYTTNTKLNVVNGFEDISLLTTRKVISCLKHSCFIWKNKTKIYRNKIKI